MGGLVHIAVLVTRTKKNRRTASAIADKERGRGVGRGEVGMNHPAQFAEMTFSNGNSLFLNTEYITSYGYLKDQDKTAVSVLCEAKEIYFPGDQTVEIRNAFNCINADGR